VPRDGDLSELGGGGSPPSNPLASLGARVVGQVSILVIVGLAELFDENKLLTNK